MWEKIRVVFTIPELRKKILFTLGLLLVYRVGWWITLPIINQAAMRRYAESGQGMGQIFQQVAMFSAAQMNQVTIFGLGIMPYISASIIFQLLASVWPPLERLQKEGEAGRKKINEYTRYATVVLCIGQSWMYLKWLSEQQGMVLEQFRTSSGSLSFGWQLVTVLTMTTGTVFLMWLGEQIDEFGIGNGISLLIMAGILANMPGAILTWPNGRACSSREGGANWASKCWCCSWHSSFPSWPAWCSSRWGNGGYPRKAPNTSAAGGSSAATGNICRCGSIRPA